MTWFKTFKAACRLYSLFFCFCETYLLLFPMFMLAYSSGLMTCMMRINMYGEADIEIAYWMVTLPFVIYGTYLNALAIFRRDV